MGRPALFTPGQVLEAYERCGECVNATARHLGCTAMTVRNYLKKAGWAPDAPSAFRGRALQASHSSTPVPIQAVRVEVGLSALVDARVVFNESAHVGQPCPRCKGRGRLGKAPEPATASCYTLPKCTACSGAGTRAAYEEYKARKLDDQSGKVRGG